MKTFLTSFFLLLGMILLGEAAAAQDSTRAERRRAAKTQVTDSVGKPQKELSRRAKRKDSLAKAAAKHPVAKPVDSPVNGPVQHHQTEEHTIAPDYTDTSVKQGQIPIETGEITPVIIFRKRSSLNDSLSLVMLRTVPSLIDGRMITQRRDSLEKATQKLMNERLYRSDFKPAQTQEREQGAKALSRKFKSPDAVYIVFGLFLLFTLISYFFGKDIKSILEGFVSNRTLHHLVRDSNLLNSESFIFMAALIGLSFGYLLQVLFNIEELFGARGLGAYGFLSLIVALFFLFKTLILRLAGALFSLTPMVNNYLSIVYISFGTFSMVLIPLLILHVLGPEYLSRQIRTGFLIILALSFLYQYVRGAFFVSRSFRLSAGYFILYICACEICPILIVYKMLLEVGNR